MRIPAFIGVLVLLCGAALPAAAKGLVPHRAVYDMKLGTVSGSSGITGIRGAMQYRFADSCDGWTVENKTYLRIIYSQGNEVETFWNFVSWESKDGLKYNFRVRHERDGKVVENLKGRARLTGKGKAGSAAFTEPEDTFVKLSAGTLFPTEHLQFLLREVKKGQRHVVRTMFDGASLDNPYMVSALMAGKLAGSMSNLAKPFSSKVDPSPSWPMHMAFYPRGKKNELPEFEISASYRQDGIADKINQNFGDFSLDLSMSDLELLPKPPC